MFPLLTYLFGCSETASSSRAFCPSIDEFGVSDPTCRAINKASAEMIEEIDETAESADTAVENAPEPKAEIKKDSFILCHSIDEFGIRDPNCKR